MRRLITTANARVRALPENGTVEIAAAVGIDDPDMILSRYIRTQKDLIEELARSARSFHEQLVAKARGMTLVFDVEDWAVLVDTFDRHFVENVLFYRTNVVVRHDLREIHVEVPANIELAKPVSSAPSLRIVR